MNNLNEQIVSDIPFPILTIDEQEALLLSIESRFSVCDQLERIVDESLVKADALRQSILKKAFEGKLVPQDPNDEPAEKLLARIRMEREEKKSLTEALRTRR
jgi:type I restriction enzyme S subunit